MVMTSVQANNVYDLYPPEVMLAPPLAQAYIELPVYGVPPPDRKWIVDMIIRELDNGQFANAGFMSDSMMRDGRLSGALVQRLAGVFSSPLCIEAADESNLAHEIRDDIELNFYRMFPRAELERILKYAIIMGIAIAGKHWEFGVKKSTFKLVPFRPRWYLWREDTLSYHIMTRNAGLVRVPQRSTEWFVHAPYGYDRAFLEGSFRALVDAWLMRCWNKSDWAKWVENHSKPIKKAIVPQQATPAQEKDFVKAVSQMGADTTLKVRQDKDGNKYDLELLEATAMGWKGIESLMNWADKEIAQVLLGQNMSMDGQGGLNSQEDPGRAVRGDIRLNDATKLCESLVEQALREYCERNWNAPDLVPVISYMVEPSEDEQKRAAAQYAQAQADQIYVNMGAVTPEEIALSRFGSGEFSLDTEIDVEARNRMLDASLARLEEEVNETPEEEAEEPVDDGDEEPPAAA